MLSDSARFVRQLYLIKQVLDVQHVDIQACIVTSSNHEEEH